MAEFKTKPCVIQLDDDDTEIHLLQSEIENIKEQLKSIVDKTITQNDENLFMVCLYNMRLAKLTTKLQDLEDIF